MEDGTDVKRIKLSTGGFCIVDDIDYEYLKEYTWRQDQHGYASNVRRIKRRTVTILMHRLIINAPEGFDTDHINRNRLDNRRSNLRVCTRSQNNMNSKIRIDNNSGSKGVSWHKQTNKWRSYINYGGKQISLGLFSRLSDAVIARRIKAKELYGEFINE